MGTLVKKLGLAALTACALMAAESVNAAVNLVSNGGFDANTPAKNAPPLDWSLVVGSDPNFIVGSPVGFVSSPNAANFGSKGIVPDELFQDEDLTFGKTYVFSFDLEEAGDVSSNYFSVMYGPITLLTIQNTPAFAFKTYTFTITGDGPGTILAFFGKDDGSVFALDNVSIVAAPEPATWALMLAGFAGLGAVLRSRRASSVLA